MESIHPLSLQGPEAGQEEVGQLEVQLVKDGSRVGHVQNIGEVGLWKTQSGGKEMPRNTKITWTEADRL